MGDCLPVRWESVADWGSKRGHGKGDGKSWNVPANLSPNDSSVDRVNSKDAPLASPAAVPPEELICGGLFQERHRHVSLSVHGHSERTTSGDFGDVDHPDVPG